MGEMMRDRMFMSRTPLRITFVGGGTDLPSYYRTHGTGSIVSATINRYIYIVVNKKFDNKIRISYSKTEIVDRIDQIEHPSVREALRLLELDGGIEIVSISDIPSSGTGLGSSSTFLVGLLNALHAYKGEHVSNKQLAEEAVKIEREILQEPGGKQDQYAAAYGGINIMDFYSDETVSVNPIIMKEDYRSLLEKSILLLYTGKSRKSTEIHNRQSASADNKAEIYGKMANLAFRFRDSLCEGNINVLGEMLHENWKLKKQLAEGISSSSIDEIYEKGLKAGAIGGKIVGAGGGGFFLFLAPEDKRQSVISACSPMREERISFDYSGSRIMFVGE